MSEGKNAKAAIINITTNVSNENVDVSVFSVHSLCGIYFIEASKLTIAICHIIGK